MKKSKVTLLALSITAILGFVVVAVPSDSIADLSWSTDVLNQANKDLGAVGYAKKNELLGKDITSEMKNSLNPVIDEQERELEKMLEEYYQMKINNLTDTEEFRELEKKIEEIRVNIFERYKKDIDSLFD